MIHRNSRMLQQIVDLDLMKTTPQFERHVTKIIAKKL